jgi:hypothetical protein
MGLIRSQLEQTSTHGIGKISLFENNNKYKSLATFDIIENRHAKDVSTLIGLICIDFEIFAKCSIFFSND